MLKHAWPAFEGEGRRGVRVQSAIVGVGGPPPRSRFALSLALPFPSPSNAGHAGYAKIGRGYTGGLSRVRLWTALKRFCFKMEPDFPNFSLNFDFQDSENETPNKRIKK